MIFEIIKFIVYSALIVIISKYILVKTLRNLAENLELKAKTVGEVAGYATSMPEFLTITTSSLSGLMSASIYNIISSNVINLIQYTIAIIINKNSNILKNKAIKTDLIMVLITIAIPIVLICTKIEASIEIVPIFIILYVLFKIINNNVHKVYLKREDKILEKEIEKEAKWEKGNKKKTKKHILVLILTGIALYVIGDRLGNVLENLCNIFKIPEFLIGILLGFITSIPELITFFEAQKHHKNQQNEMLNLFIIQSIGVIIYYIIT